MIFVILTLVTLVNLGILACNIGVLTGAIKLHTETVKQATLRDIRDKEPGYVKTSNGPSRSRSMGEVS